MTQDSVAIPAKEYYAKRARHYLAERGLDEQVLAAVSIQPAGQSQDTLNRNVGRAVGSAAGSAAGGALGGTQGSEVGYIVGNRVGRAVADDLNAGREVPVGRATWADGQVPKNGMLVLTTGRLLVFSKAAMGLFSAKPKAAAMDIPLVELSGVSDLVETRVAGMNTVQVAIGLRAGGALRIEFPMVAVKNGTALIAELSRRIGAGQG